MTIQERVSQDPFGFLAANVEMALQDDPVLRERASFVGA